MFTTQYTLLLFVLFTVAAFAGYFLYRPKSRNIVKKAENTALKMISEAEIQKLQIARENEEPLKLYASRISDQQEKHDFRRQKLENAIAIHEEKLAGKTKINQELVTVVENERKAVKQIQAETLELKQGILPRLAEVANQSREEVLEKILQELNEDLQLANELRMNKIIEHLTYAAPEEARDIMTMAIQKYESISSVDKKSPLIPIRKNETKLKLIGNNCENLKFIEEATGVNIIFDEERKGLLVTHFQLVKKHIARETVLKLMREKNITLDLVKIKFAEAEKDTEQMLIKIGNDVLKKLRLDYRKFSDSFKELVGRMDFRTSYGQNILRHSYEVGYFAMIIGSELGLDVEICLLGGFLGDIGKAIDQEEGRPHDILTKEIMEHYNFTWEEIHASWTHHDSIPIETAEALVVKGADAMSAGRPGARLETIEKYQERVQAIEGIAVSHEGVKKTYAISGGRELRVFVEPQKLKDADLQHLADSIAGEIEGTVAYPGQIKIRVIRRTQHKKILKEKAST